MTLDGLEDLVERYRNQRAKGVSEPVARANLFTQLGWKNPASRILDAKPTIERKLERVEKDLARDDDPGTAA